MWFGSGCCKVSGPGTHFLLVMDLSDLGLNELSNKGCWAANHWTENLYYLCDFELKMS